MLTRISAVPRLDPEYQPNYTKSPWGGLWDPLIKDVKISDLPQEVLPLVRTLLEDLRSLAPDLASYVEDNSLCSCIYYPPPQDQGIRGPSKIAFVSIEISARLNGGKYWSDRSRGFDISFYAPQMAPRDVYQVQMELDLPTAKNSNVRVEVFSRASSYEGAFSKFKTGFEDLRSKINEPDNSTPGDVLRNSLFGK